MLLIARCYWSLQSCCPHLPLTLPSPPPQKKSLNLPPSRVSVVIKTLGSLVPSAFLEYTRKLYFEAGLSPVQLKPGAEPNTTLLVLCSHLWEVNLHSTVYSMIAALPSNLLLHVKYTEPAVTTSTSGLDGGYGLSGNKKCQKFLRKSRNTA